MTGWRVLCRYAPLDHFPWSAEASHTDWLSPAELAEYSRFRDTQRRHAWLVGRLLGKQLIYDRYREQVDGPRAVEIQSRDNQGRAVRPEVRLEGRPHACSLSISHSQRGVLVAICDDPGISLGVDLAHVEPYGAAFLQMWFTPEEREWLEQTGSMHAAAIWAAKEAVYKANNRGEGFARNGSKFVHCRLINASVTITERT